LGASRELPVYTECDQPISVLVIKRPDKNAVDEAKKRSVRADA
jgi:hypothetical protein